MGSDGMTIDDEGNVYLTNARASPLRQNRQAGREHQESTKPWTGNVCFGGKDGHTLFITASKGAYSIKMRVKGAGSQ